MKKVTFAIKQASFFSESDSIFVGYAVTLKAVASAIVSAYEFGWADCEAGEWMEI